MTPIHPLFVHFPIALLMVGGIFYGLELILKKEEFGTFGFYLLIGGVVGVVAAIASGNFSESEIIHTQEIHELLGDHATIGWVVAWVFAILLTWAFLRKGRQTTPEKAVFMAIYAIGIGVMIYGAHLGGELVYEKGAGVAPMYDIHKEQMKKEQKEQRQQTGH